LPGEEKELWVDGVLEERRCGVKSAGVESVKRRGKWGKKKRKKKEIMGHV
jgi:hypothetical protein